MMNTSVNMSTSVNAHFSNASSRKSGSFSVSEKGGAAITVTESLLGSRTALDKFRDEPTTAQTLSSDEADSSAYTELFNTASLELGTAGGYLAKNLQSVLMPASNTNG